MIAQQRANIIITTLTIHSNCTSSTDVQLSKIKFKDMPVAVKYMSKERQTQIIHAATLCGEQRLT